METGTQQSRERCYCGVCRKQRTVVKISRGHYKCVGCQTIGLIQTLKSGRIFIPEIRKNKLEKLEKLQRLQNKKIVVPSETKR